MKGGTARRPLRIAFMSGHVDFLRPESNDRRFFALTRTDVLQIKQFITARDDKFRPTEDTSPTSGAAASE